MLKQPSLLAATIAVVIVISGLFTVPIEAVSIDLWMRHGWEEKEGVSYALEQFAKDYPEVEVNIVLQWTGAEQILVAAAGGVGPDVALLPARHPVELAAKGLGADLSGYLARIGKLEQLMADILPVGLEGNVYNEKLVAIPLTSSVEAFYYNQDLMNAFGLTPPREGWTWDEFLQMSQRGTRRTRDDAVDVWGTAFLNNNVALELFHQAGGEFYTEDLKRVDWDSPAGREAWEFFRALVNDYEAATVPGIQPARSLFANGQALFIRDGNYSLASDHIAQVNVGIAPALVGKRPANLSGGFSAMPFDYGDPEKAEAALALANIFARSDVQATFSATDASFPTVRSAIVEPAFQALIFEQPLLQHFAVRVEYATRKFYNTPVGYDLQRLFASAVGRVLAGETSVDNALTEAARVANAMLQELER